MNHLMEGGQQRRGGGVVRRRAASRGVVQLRQVRELARRSAIRRLLAPVLGFFFSSRRRHTRFDCDWSSDVCSSDLKNIDVAFVCMNLPYTMPPVEAAEAVRAFHPKIVYPYHYRGSDLSVFQKALEGSGIEVRLLDWYPK